MDDARDDVEELTLEPAAVVRSRRPRALWGVLAAVGLAAGALVVTSTGEDGTTRPGLPVALGSAASPEAAGAAADAMLAWVTYVAGDDLPALGGEAPAYRLRGSVDEADARALADALGVDGDIVHEGPGWKVAGAGGTLEVYEGAGAQWWYSSTSYSDPAVGSGSSTGSAGAGVACPEASDDVVSDCDLSTVTTYASCTASDGPAECITGECPPIAECALPPPTTVACPPNADCGCIAPDPVEGCAYPEPPLDGDCAVDADGYRPCIDNIIDPPAPPADLPSADEARAIALELLAATGMDTDGADVTVDGPYDAWYVTVEPRIDGVPSGLLATVSIGANGEVTNAGGYLGTPERLGDYPVLDTRAAIDRANAQQGDGSAYGGGVDVGAPAMGIAEAPAGDDPGPADGKDRPAECEACNGNGEGGVATCPEDKPDCYDVIVAEEPATTIAPRCKVQPDGSEICEVVEPGISCPQVAAPGDEPLGAPETIECTPPPPDPGVVPEPMPEPEPVEVVLVDAEPSLVLLGANDGSTDAYLVPGYRFTDADGGRVDLPAVADEALTGPPTTETTVPETPVPPDPGGVDPQPCDDVLVEEDASGTTHTVQPNPNCVEPTSTEPVTLPEGEEPQIGVGYYVDVHVLLHCNYITVEVADRWWWADGIPTEDLDQWSQPTEGGTFTLFEEDRAEFVGDAGRTKLAELRLFDGTDPDQPLCA